MSSSKPWHPTSLWTKYRTKLDLMYNVQVISLRKPQSVLDTSTVSICNTLIDKKLVHIKTALHELKKKPYNSKTIKTFSIIEAENNVLV